MDKDDSQLIKDYHTIKEIWNRNATYPMFQAIADSVGASSDKFNLSKKERDQVIQSLTKEFNQFLVGMVGINE